MKTKEHWKKPIDKYRLGVLDTKKIKNKLQVTEYALEVL